MLIRRQEKKQQLLAILGTSLVHKHGIDGHGKILVGRWAWQDIGGRWRVDGCVRVSVGDGYC